MLIFFTDSALWAGTVIDRTIKDLRKGKYFFWAINQCNNNIFFLIKAHVYSMIFKKNLNWITLDKITVIYFFINVLLFNIMFMQKSKVPKEFEEQIFKNLFYY